MDFSRVQFSDFAIIGELARAPAGAIYKARFKRTGQVMVLKERRHGEVGGHAPVEYEAQLLANLDHPNVIKCFGIVVSGFFTIRCLML